MHNDLHALRRILKTCTTIAVVGLSAEWHRPSYFAAKYMQSHGFKIVPVNPRYVGGEILGEVLIALFSTAGTYLVTTVGMVLCLMLATEAGWQKIETTGSETEASQ
mgnify:CR=1 FL=1